MGNCCGGDKIGPSAPHQIEYETGSDKIRRKPTDTCFLTLFAVVIVIFLCFLGYCIHLGDIYRVVNGYDDCGYVCSRKNQPNSDPQFCPKYDKTSDKYFLLKLGSSDHTLVKECVSKCPVGYTTVPLVKRCFPEKKLNSSSINQDINEFIREVTEDFQVYWKELGYICLISLGMSFLLLILFRFMVGPIVWLVLIGVTLACIVGTAFLWLLYKSADEEEEVPSYFFIDIGARKKTTYLVFAIASSVLTVIVLLIIIVMRKRINLVIQLFEEASKAITHMPVLLFQPVVTFVVLGGVVCLWLYFTLWIDSAGRLKEKSLNSHTYKYEKDGFIIGAMWYNIFAALWMIQFVIGCQHMMIAGAVAMWYFRQKKSVGSPVFVSFYNLTRYHLGSVALGSLLIAIVQFARICLKATERFLNDREGKIVKCLLCCCQCCLYCFERFLKYFTRNAYIEVALYGYSFCTGGYRAFKQLMSNILNVAAINSVGDFVLFLGKIAVMVATILISFQWMKKIEHINHMWVPITLAGLFAYFVAHCFMTVFEMTIDTIFLCFCEDCEKNDGISRPYYMSRGLMEFVENSKKALNIRDVQRMDDRSPRKGDKH